MFRDMWQVRKNHLKLQKKSQIQNAQFTIERSEKTKKATKKTAYLREQIAVLGVRIGAADSAPDSRNAVRQAKKNRDKRIAVLEISSPKRLWPGKQA
jgi:hypothetical protein